MFGAQLTSLREIQCLVGSYLHQVKQYSSLKLINVIVFFNNQAWQ